MGKDSLFLPPKKGAAAGRALAGGEGRAVAVAPRQALSAMQIRCRAFLAQQLLGSSVLLTWWRGWGGWVGGTALHCFFELFFSPLLWGDGLDPLVLDFRGRRQDMTSWCLEMAQVQWLWEGGARNNYRFVKHQALPEKGSSRNRSLWKINGEAGKTVRPTIVVMG